MQPVSSENVFLGQPQVFYRPGEKIIINNKFSSESGISKIHKMMSCFTPQVQMTIFLFEKWCLSALLCPQKKVWRPQNKPWWSIHLFVSKRKRISVFASKQHQLAHIFQKCEQFVEKCRFCGIWVHFPKKQCHKHRLFAKDSVSVSVYLVFEVFWKFRVYIVGVEAREWGGVGGYFWSLYISVIDVSLCTARSSPFPFGFGSIWVQERWPNRAR